MGVDNFRKELRSIEIERLINRLKQRQFLIEGFNCKLHSEKEFVEFYKQKIEENQRDIIIWSEKFWQYSNDTVEESSGNFSELLQKTTYSRCDEICKRNEKIV